MHYSRSFIGTLVTKTPVFLKLSFQIRSILTRAILIENQPRRIFSATVQRLGCTGPFQALGNSFHEFQGLSKKGSSNVMAEAHNGDLHCPFGLHIQTWLANVELGFLHAYIKILC